MRTWIAILAATSLGLLGACSDNDGVFEEAGEQIDEAADDAADAIDEATEDLDDRN